MMYHLLQLKKFFVSASFIAIAFSAFSQSADWYWGQQGSPFEKSDGSGMSVATDKWGNAYHCGAYASGVSFGSAVLMSSSTDQVAFLVKYNSAGTVRWAVQGNTVNNNQSVGNAVATDDSGFVYVTGYFGDTVQFGNTPMLAAPGSTNAFLVKYDSNGNALWAVQSYTPQQSIFTAWAASYGVSADRHGGVYITGYFSDTIMIGTQMLISPFYDAFVAKYDKFGNFLWARQSSSARPNDVVSYGVATDSSGNAYITGGFGDTVFFGASQLISGGSDMFITKYSPTGNVLWATQSHAYLSHGYTISLGIAVDSFGGVYTSGAFDDTVTFGTTTLQSFSPAANDNIFFAKYFSNGNFDWVKQGKSLDSNSWSANDISTDNRGHEYLACGVQPINGAYLKLQYGNDTVKLNIGSIVFSENPAILLELDTAGRLLCKTIVTDGGNGNAVASDATGNYVYMGGTGDETFNAQAVWFGSDSLWGGAGGVYPYVARWQSCCGTINTTGSSIDDTCNQPNGIAMAHANGTYSPFSYSWSPAGGNDSVAHSLTAGTYSVTISNAKGCSKVDLVTVNNHNVPASVNVCCDTILITGNSVTLNATGANKYSWTPNINLSCDTCASTTATPTITTEYYVTVSNKQGCRALDSVLITVDSAEKPCGNVFVPNAFSPNGDNVNDVEYVYGDCIQSLDFKIFDRWGNKVFETTDPTIGWNGIFNGKPASSDVYDYTLIATQSNGKTTSQKGNITLVR
jgi:gliding motility-associated-like protein